jgi:hypothetical protein
MPSTRWIKAEATIVECFRAYGERPANTYPSLEIVADMKVAGISNASAHSRRRPPVPVVGARPIPSEVVPENRAKRITNSARIEFYDDA